MDRIRNIAFAVLVAAIIYVCFFNGISNLGLVGPDEPRYAWVAREMVESGDWVTPRLYGKPWFEKPPLYYWEAAIRFRMFGVSEFTARLPSVRAATLMTLVLAWAAWRFYGAATARAVLLMFPTCVGVFGFARAATTDMMFSALLGVAMICAAVLAGFPAGNRPKRYWLLLFGATLGLATLAKGPAAVVLAGGSVGLWALATRRWKEAFRLTYPSAVISFLVVAAPWYVLCARRNPEFVRTFLISHNIERYLTSAFQHEQLVWFYGPILLLGLLPWTALLAGVARDGVSTWREGKLRDSAGFFLACWVLFPLLFFSFSKSKLPGYILPVFPALVLLMARSVTRAIEEKRDAARWLLVGVGLTCLVLLALSGQWLSRLPAWWAQEQARNLLAAHAAIGAIAIVVVMLGWSRREQAALLLSAALITGIVGVVTQKVLTVLDYELSPRATAALADSMERTGETIYLYRLHRAWQYGFDFYLHRDLPEWTAEAGPAWVFTNSEGVAEIERQGHRVIRVKSIWPRQAFLVHIETGR